MRTLKLVAVWIAYLVICTVILFTFPLAPLPALALYMGGYLFVLWVIIPRFFPPEKDETEDETEE